MGSIPGGGGLDVNSIVSQILYAERAPARRLEFQRSQLQTTDSAYADLASRVSDLSSKLSGLINGTFAAKTATSSNPNIFTASASSSAQVGLYAIKVNQLAQAGTFASTAFTDATTQTIGVSGTFTITLSGGTQSISVAANDTLSAIQTKINNLRVPVTASIITDSSGARLSLISNSTGAANDIISLSGSVGALSFSRASSGLDAQFTVNGISISSASNTVTTAINGVTLNLLQKDTVNTYTLTVAADTTSIKKSLSDFTSAYNALANYAKQQFTFNSASNRSGILSGDPTLRQIMSDLQTKLNGKFDANTTYKSLASIGIEFQQDGTLSINDSTLTTALTNNPTEVQNLFTAANSVGQQVNASLNTAGNPTDGLITTARNGLSTLMSDINQRVLDIDQRLSFRQQALIAQFSRADAALRNLATMQNQIGAQLRGL